jgi:hypothetical protein
VITENIKLILVVTGVLTTAAGLGGFLLPRSLFRLFFGVEEAGEAVTLLTRHWGWLGFLIGALVVYAAFDPGLRVPVVVAAALEKIVFAGLVLLGPLKKSGLARWAAAGDSFMVLLYVLYLSGF